MTNPITDFEYIGTRHQQRVNGNDTRIQYAYNAFESLVALGSNTLDARGIERLTMGLAEAESVIDSTERAWIYRCALDGAYERFKVQSHECPIVYKSYDACVLFDIAARESPLSIPRKTNPCNGSTEYQYAIPNNPRGRNLAVISSSVYS